MNRIKRLFLDRNLDVSNKVYIVFSAAAAIVVLIAFFISVITGGGRALTFGLWIMFFVFSISLVYSVYKRRFYVPSIISCALISFLFFPFVFLSQHLYFGAIPIWMVVGYAHTGLVLRGKTRVIVIFIQSMINIFCFIIAFTRNWEAVIVDYSDTSRLVDHWFAVVGGGLVLFLVATFNKWLNSLEQKTIKAQRDDIVSLYQNQNRFFSSMSHEIRTPINTIMGLNEVNLSLSPSEDILEYSTEIEHASKKLLTLINDILDLAKLQSGKMEIVDVEYNLSDMISSITDDVWKESYDKGIKLKIITEPRLPAGLMGDEIRIRQIVRNLLTYSINTTEAGTVTLQIRHEDISPEEAILIFEVSDTGMGMRREEIPFVFDTFRYTGEDATDREGTGLELPIAKNLSDIMGGNIDVDSIYRRGSKYTFSVRQKLVACSLVFEKEAPKEKKSFTNFTAQTAKVLVVDDDGMNLNVFKRMFSGVFSNIDTASGGEEAIGLCKAKDYDLVFIDHLMPGMDGLETLSKIQEIREDIVAVALTANSGSDARALYREAGFTDYLSKPIDKEYALRTIYKLLPSDKIERLDDGADSTGKNEDTVQKEENTEQRRSKIIITTDSVADIPGFMLEEQNIPIIPFYVNTSEGKRYKDQLEISSESLISFINNDDRYAFSEPAAEWEYEIFFGNVLKQADRIIHVATAKNNSPAYDNAVAASKSFANVEVIDSGNVCFGLGVMAIDAAKLAASGAPVEEIREKILSDREKIKFDFVVDETRNLAATGRIPLIVHRICSFFNIHPVIKLRDSKLVVRTVRIGDINKIRDRYFKKICNQKDISEDFLALLHCNVDAEALKKLEKELQENIPTNRFVTVLTGPAVASNSGRGAFGICYRQK